MEDFIVARGERQMSASTVHVYLQHIMPFGIVVTRHALRTETRWFAFFV